MWRIFSAVCFLFIASPLFAETMENQAVVLMYHHFGVDKHPSTNVRLEQFDAHLQYLSDAGYAVWPLARVAEYIQQGKPFPERVVAITVDDAYTSVYTEAYPRLRARDWPFTVFVATDGVDKGYQAYMTWDQMREMQPHGVSFANHSATHDYLIRRYPEESETQWLSRMKADIGRAQRRLQEELGEAPMLLAYPYGEYDTPLANLVVELGYVAFGQHSGAAGIGADTRALPRYPMAERFADMAEFRTKVASLAFPIRQIEPWSPLLGQDHRPRLQVKLQPSAARLSELSCFVSGQGEVAVEWLDRKAGWFAVQAESPLPSGRSRYNCTAPSPQTGRFYWYSHLWITPQLATP